MAPVLPVSANRLPGWGIGVEIAEFEQLLQPRRDAGADQGGGIEVVSFQFQSVLQLDAVDPAGGEHAPAGELPLHLWHRHGWIGGEQISEALGVVGLAAVVDLLEQAAAEFIDDVAEAEAQVQRQEGGRQHAKAADDHQVAAQLIGEIRALHLHGHPVPVRQFGLINLAQAGGGHRVGRKRGEQLVGRSSQLLLDQGQRHRMGEGGQVVLQLAQLIEPVAPHQVGPGGEGLPHFDEAGTKRGERGEDAAAEPLLHLPVVAVALHGEHHRKTQQLPQHPHQPRDQDPRPAQQPAAVAPGVVTERRPGVLRTGGSGGASWRSAASWGSSRGGRERRGSDGRCSCAAGGCRPPTLGTVFCPSCH